MNKQTRKDILQLGIEPMTTTGLHDQCSNHSAIQAQFYVYFSSLNDILIIESQRKQNVDIGYKN